MTPPFDSPSPAIERIKAIAHLMKPDGGSLETTAACQALYLICLTIKIGHVQRAGNLVKRMRTLQNACAEPVRVRRLIQTRPEDALELVLHARFAEHRLEGEWFAPAPEILAYIEEGP